MNTDPDPVARFLDGIGEKLDALVLVAFVVAILAGFVR